MARVYISSTYEDMKAHREVIGDLVRQLKPEPIGMEDYTAEGSLPLAILRACCHDDRAAI